MPISVNVREAENQRLLSQSGATTVVLSSEAAGRLVGRSTESPEAVHVIEDLLSVGGGLDLLERLVRPHELGGPPRNEGEVPDDAEFQRTAPGDIVVCLVRNRRDEP